MSWDVAAGVLVGGVLLALMHYGINTPSYDKDGEIPGRAYALAAMKFLIAAGAFACAVWIVFFRAHWG